MQGLIGELGPDVRDPHQFGGKGAALGRLIELGHRVPAGLAISSRALAETLTDLGLHGPIERLQASMEQGLPDLTAGETIRQALLAATLAPELEESLRSRIDADGLGDHLIARSSAAVEDAATHSYAGMFESLRIRGLDGLDVAIRSVWASAFTPRALTYAQHAGLRTVPTMAVVVQRFIDASRSGVMFTSFAGADGRVATLVEHVAGTAERLVGGEVTPETLWLDGADVRTGGLSTDHADQLADLARRLEQELGRPQDVEWCIGDGELYVVQSRPITAGFDPAVAEPVAEGTVVLRGTGASPGMGGGDVHLAFNVEQALALRPGQVLVTPMTNPDMVVAMRNSRGIVTDVGGMICHAAIVSRELQLPCVVGTGEATQVLVEGRTVTVDGTAGRVLDGLVAAAATAQRADAGDWWRRWLESAPAGAIPSVWTVDLVAAAPPSVDELVYIVDGDLRCGVEGLWRPLSGDGLHSHLDALLATLGEVTGGSTVRLETRGAVPDDDLARAVERAALPDVTTDPVDPGTKVLPIGAGIADGSGARQALPPVDESVARAADPSSRPGPPPTVRMGPMPHAASRMAWWDLLPEYGRFHAEHGTATDDGAYPWIEIRPEVITSPLLKSLVLPGFEMVPRVLGFAGSPPMHTKWFRGRFHVRADTFAETWGRIVAGTWDSGFMEEFVAKVRQSYGRLGEVLSLFPQTPQGYAGLSDEQIVALITSWWPRWVEFFALCLFIQAQGEDVLFPVIEETVAANLQDLAPAPDGRVWPGSSDLIAPTTPVLSGQYLESVGRVRSALDVSGCTSVEEAMGALHRGDTPGLAAAISDHLRHWHWMRDRDLLFEPWDTPERVVDTALGTSPHPPPRYDTNLARNRLALAVHTDLTPDPGRSAVLQHGVRFLQDLNVERENHHVLWLKYSYPLRQLMLEIERRLASHADLPAGSVFFMQAPELIAALHALPATPPAALVERAASRRRGYRHETHFERVDEATLAEEDDYF